MLVEIPASGAGGGGCLQFADWSVLNNLVIMMQFFL